MTCVIICRKSDRKIRTVHVSEPVDTIRERYVKAALGNRHFYAGKWSIDLDENLVLSIDQVFSCVGNPNQFGERIVVRRTVGRKRSSSAGH